MRKIQPPLEYTTEVGSLPIIIEDALLQEPNLWTAGKKPIGPVKIDWTHPLSAGLVGAFLLDSKVVLNLATQNVDGLWDATDPPIIRVGDGEKCTYFKSSTSDQFNGDYLYPFYNSVAPPDSDDFSVAIKFRHDFVPVATQFPYLIHTREVDNKRFVISLNGNTSGVLSLDINNATGDSQTDVDSITIDINTHYNVVATYADSGDRKARLHVLGTTYTAASALTGTLSPYRSTEGGVVLGDFNDGKAVSGDISYFFMWRRKLSDEEAHEFNRDPYQFLIPA